MFLRLIHGCFSDLQVLSLTIYTSSKIYDSYNSLFEWLVSVESFDTSENCPSLNVVPLISFVCGTPFCTLFWLRTVVWETFLPRCQGHLVIPQLRSRRDNTLTALIIIECKIFTDTIAALATLQEIWSQPLNSGV